MKLACHARRRWFPTGGQASLPAFGNQHMSPRTAAIRSFLDTLSQHEAQMLSDLDADFRDESKWSKYADRLLNDGVASLPSLRTMAASSRFESVIQSAHAKAVISTESLPSQLAYRWLDQLAKLLRAHRRLTNACLDAAEQRKSLDTWDIVKKNRDLRSRLLRELMADEDVVELPPCVYEEDRKTKGGRKRVEDKNPKMARIYGQIVAQHDDKKPSEILAELKKDNAFRNEVKEAGLTLDLTLIKRALSWQDWRARNGRQVSDDI